MLETPSLITTDSTTEGTDFTQSGDGNGRMFDCVVAGAGELRGGL